MAQTISQHQHGAISTPANNGGLVSSVVRGNFQTLRSIHNDHDADPGIHFQSSTNAAKPAAGTAGRKWLETDTLKVFFDNGSTWSEIAYAPTASPTFTGTTTVADLTASGSITGTLATAAQPNITSLGTLTALGVAGNVTFSGANRKIVAGSTALLIRNNADDATNVTVADAGDVTFRSGATVTVPGTMAVTGTLSLSNLPSVHALATVGQTVAAGDPVLCSTEDFDSEGMHDNGSNTGRLTIPAGQGGTYVFWGRLAVNTGTSSVQWKLNNTTSFGAAFVTGQDVAGEAFAIRTVSAGDYVELRSSAEITLTSNGGGNDGWLAAWRIA